MENRLIDIPSICMESSLFYWVSSGFPAPADSQVLDTFKATVMSESRTH